MVSPNEWALPEERFVILLLMVSNEASCLFRCPEQRDRCFIKRDNIPRFSRLSRLITIMATGTIEQNLLDHLHQGLRLGQPQEACLGYTYT